jgi:hypothetical protein
MSKKTFIDAIEVKNPCSEDWNEMTGTDKIRFCSHCSTHVNNLSEMTRKEALRLVRASNGKLCIRYIQDPATRRPMFAEQLLQITRRTPGIAAGVMSASIALSTHAYAQESTPVPTPVIVAERSATNGESPDAKTSRLTGTVYDPNRAVIQNANVTIYGMTNSKTYATKTDENGVYKFDDLPIDTYRVEVESPGFKKGDQIVAVAETADAIGDVSLSIGMATTVEVIGDERSRWTTMGTMGVVVTRVVATTAIARAVDSDNIDEVHDLVIRGHNVNSREKRLNNITPLFIAVENGNVEMVQLLLNFRAKVNARDSSKQTPLMRLDYDATPELVDLLVRYGAKVNLVDSEGNTALILAASSAKADVLKALIDAGADVRAANKEGQTALMEAASNGEVDAVKLLIESGSEVNAKNKAGKSAWDFASNDEIEKLLVSYGAEVHIDQE